MLDVLKNVAFYGGIETISVISLTRSENNAELDVLIYKKYYEMNLS